MNKLAENIGVLIHRLLIMNRRVNKIASHLTEFIPKNIISILDVGAGSGEVAKAICQLRPELIISGVDVKIREKTFIPITKYDGSRLPFEDNTFDLIIAVDILHHCVDPVAMLKECVRVSKKWVIIKDHICETRLDWILLRLMDWIGNSFHGVVLPYNYLSSSEWESLFNQTGLKIIRNRRHLALYPMPFDLIFGSSLHCLFLLKKEASYE
jgi:ubiquinone/menaquinone biosynthesis C-methylase UbiE